MKINIIVDSAGSIVGTARAAIPEKGGKAEAPEVEVGIAPPPGQSVHEVEVPDELVQLEGPELLRRLSDFDSVKEALSTIVTAGQG
jgi:hypothetical protein